MSECPAPDSSGLILVSSAGDGALIARQAASADLPCTMHPPLSAVLADLAGGGDPPALRLLLPGRPPVDGVALAAPHDPGSVVVVPGRAACALAGPVVEHLVNQIAHDVRNYSFSMGLQAEIGSRRLADTVEGQGTFDSILRQVAQLRAYLDWLLLYGRRPRPSPALMDAAELVRAEIQSLHSGLDAQAADAAVAVEAEPDAIPVRWDRRLMGAALRAVLDNALRSATPPPPVRVRIRADHQEVVLEVADQGPGIPADQVNDLFVPMAVRRAGGAGLGLAIARKMARAHGGALELTTGGRGTTVRFRLPREAPPG